jgi:hypothetical protein
MPFSFNGTEYFIAGGGALVDENQKSTVAKLNWIGTGYGAFATIEATLSNLTVNFIDYKGQKLFFLIKFLT